MLFLYQEQQGPDMIAKCSSCGWSNYVIEPLDEGGPCPRCQGEKFKESLFKFYLDEEVKSFLRQEKGEEEILTLPQIMKKAEEKTKAWQKRS